MAILKDTSLCAIIRDEMINPAGGIERFVRSIVPYVEQAVIFDTGSVDGTREKLDELQGEFPQMKVYDRPFDNYVNSRNASLDKVKTKWALILDADELITQKGLLELNNIFGDVSNKVQGFSFEMICVSPDREDFSHPDVLHNPRLFRNRDYFRYRGSVKGSFSEYLHDFSYFSPKRVDENKDCKSISSPKIYHFLPAWGGIALKDTYWYYNRFAWTKSPSTLKGFKDWKEYNPKRDLFN